MSYDITIVNKHTHEPAHAKEKHSLNGGTYIIGGTDELWLNITYNYAPMFMKAFAKHEHENKSGIHVIEDEELSTTIPWIEEAISSLGTDVGDDYWEVTEGNARKALEDLLALAKMCPDGDYIWEIG